MKTLCLLMILYVLRAAARVEVSVAQRVLARAAWRLNAARRDLVKLDADIAAIESPPCVLPPGKIAILRPLASRTDVH